MSYTQSKYRPLTVGLTLCCTLLLSQASLAEKLNSKAVPDIQIKQVVPDVQSKQAVQLSQPSQVIQGHTQQSAGHAPSFQIPFSTSCASGFSLAKNKEENAYGSKWTDWYVCTTPVISCPKQIQQANGKTSTVHPTVILQTIGGNPDGGQISFRIQYKCDYGWVADPAA